MQRIFVGPSCHPKPCSTLTRRPALARTTRRTCCKRLVPSCAQGSTSIAGPSSPFQLSCAQGWEKHAALQERNVPARGERGYSTSQKRLINGVLALISEFFPAAPLSQQNPLPGRD